MSDMLTERGLPCDVDAERLVLGAIMLDGQQFPLIMGTLNAEDFSLEKHRKIFTRMVGLHDRGESINRVTVYGELKNHHEADSCDGLSYLVSLDDGLPLNINLDSYIRILREKFTLRSAIFASQRMINRCLDPTNDAASILAEAESLLAKLAEGHQQKHGQWLNPGEVMSAYPGGLNTFLQPPRGGAGTPTPWPRITADLCGLHRGDMVLVAGRPSMGKSVVGMQIAHHTTTRGEGVAVFSLEMSKDALVRRLISAVGSIDAQRLRIGALDHAERQKAARAAAEIETLPLFIDDTRARTMPAVSAALRKLITRNPVRLVIIDHLQLMKGTGRFDSRHHELSEISHALKHLAGEFDVTVVLLSQLNRECEKEARHPRLADLKETGSLEEDADVVLFVHRPEQYKRNDPTLKGKAEFIIGKQRNGPTGKRNMIFQHEFQRFVEAASIPDGIGEVDE